ncbi:MAG: TetR/AcrR family transcriptional regulator [Caldilineaceae bacterium]
MNISLDNPNVETILLEVQPARPERADAQANRARILAAAQQLFAEKGVEQVNMVEIGRAAGIGQGTLYRRFANKAAICQALLDTQMREFQDQTLQQLRSMNDAGATRIMQLRWFLQAAVQFQEQHLPMIRAICGDGLPPLGAEPPPQWLMRRTIEGLLNGAQRHGEIAAEVDLAYFVEALLVLLHPFTLYNQRTQRGFSNERIIAGLARIVDAFVQ